MKTYILTKDQLRLAILIGAKEQGIIPEDVAVAFLNSPSQISFERAENGAWLSLDMPEVTQATTNVPDDNKFFPTYSQIKTELSALMSNAPGLNTIQAWTDEQRAECWRWIQEVADSGEARPEFIKERKARSKKTVVVDVLTEEQAASEDPVSQYFADS